MFRPLRYQRKKVDKFYVYGGGCTTVPCMNNVTFTAHQLNGKFPTSLGWWRHCCHVTPVIHVRSSSVSCSYWSVVSHVTQVIYSITTTGRPRSCVYVMSMREIHRLEHITHILACRTDGEGGRVLRWITFIFPDRVSRVDSITDQYGLLRRCWERLLFFRFHDWYQRPANSLFSLCLGRSTRHVRSRLLPERNTASSGRVGPP